jgi:hypothetical protein
MRRSSRNKNKLTTAKGISITQGETNTPKSDNSVNESNGLDCSSFYRTSRSRTLEYSNDGFVIQDCKGNDDDEEADTVSAPVAAESSSQNNVTDEDDLVYDFMITNAARNNVAQTGQGEADIDLFTFTKSDLADFLKL